MDRFLIATTLAQAAGALLLAAILRAFHRHYHRRYLLHWSLSWLAFFVSAAAGAALLLLADGRADTHPARLAATFVFSFAGYLQIFWLLVGTFEFSRRREVPPRATLLALPALAVLAAATVLAFAGTPGAAEMRHFVQAGLQAMLTGLAFLVAASGVSPAAGDEARTGRQTVAVGFLLFGIEQLHYFTLSALGLVGVPMPGYGAYLGLVDFLLQALIGIGMVMSLLEEERALALRAAHQAEHLAYHDALTGLPNRRLLLDRLTVALPQARRAGERVGVVFLDLDRFKVINDSLGHPTGDRLLQEAAERIRHAVRGGDTLARIGGDEFTLLLPRLKEAEDAGAVARKVIEAVRQPFHVDGHELFVTASAGISVAPDDGADPETLLKHADVAMYRAKETGADGFRFFTPAMNERARERLELESALRRALPQGQMRLVYQPVFDVATGRALAVEALLRWEHPERGLLAPDAFLELAETTGLISAIGAWVLREACAAARTLHAAGHAGLAVLVNLSARQFVEGVDLVDEVRRVLDEAGLAPGLLELEITESLAMRDAAAAEATLRGLKTLGVRISIDDFGTGYSSFGYLRRFPVDTLKLDRAFMRAVDTDEGDAAIAAAIIAMAHRLGLRVVAEGVERPAQLEFLRAQRCDAAQGYLLARPVPAGELAGSLSAVHAPPRLADAAPRVAAGDRAG